MKDSKTLALIGAALLFVGAFMPIISVPIMGSMNYFQNGKGDGVVIVLLAVATAIFAGGGYVKHVLWTGLAALGMLGLRSLRNVLAGCPTRFCGQIHFPNLHSETSGTSLP